MTKLVKVVAYLVNFDDMDMDEIEILINQNRHIFFFRINTEEADIGEWEDDNPLNFNSTDIKEFEKYFD